MAYMMCTDKLEMSLAFGRSRLCIDVDTCIEVLSTCSHAKVCSSISHLSLRAECNLITWTANCSVGVCFESVHFTPSMWSVVRCLWSAMGIAWFSLA